MKFFTLYFLSDNSASLKCQKRDTLVNIYKTKRFFYRKRYQLNKTALAYFSVDIINKTELKGFGSACLTLNPAS